jgi:hypothetical protein
MMSKLIVKIIICITIASWPTVTFSQIVDSVCFHPMSIKSKNPTFIRKIDLPDLKKYQLNSRLFEPQFDNNSISVVMSDTIYHYPTAFVGEYTRSDSIHFIDFAIFLPPSQTFIKLNGCSNPNLSRNILPTLERLETLPGFSITSYIMYIIKGQVVSTFNLTKAEFPKHVKQALMKLDVGDKIIFDNIQVYGPDNQKRTVQNPPGYVVTD